MKIAAVNKTNRSISFKYNPMQQRVAKYVKPTSSTAEKRTYYIRDAQGNVMAVYTAKVTNNSGTITWDTFYLSEQHLYGSNRLGLAQTNRLVAVGSKTTKTVHFLAFKAFFLVRSSATDKKKNAEGRKMGVFTSFSTSHRNKSKVKLYPGTYKNPHLADSSNYAIFEGWKRYELTNHLGNVLAVVSDRKIGKSTGSYPGPALWYEADVLSTQQYYPFGMLMPGRQYAVGSYDYRYGFNGQEKTNETSGTGNHNTAMFWEYDTRIGRRWNLDPKPNPSNSNYSCFNSNPIFNVDLNGDTTYRFNKSDGKYLGMFDKDANGQIGSYGEMKTIGRGKSKQEIWDGQLFEFADPTTDLQQIRDGIINKLVFVSNDEIMKILNNQGAFKQSDKNNFMEFYQNSTGSQKFDYSYTVIPKYFGAIGASKFPLDSPSPLLFLPEGEYAAHNHMNFGNYLWGATGYTKGFNFSTLQMGAHANSLIFPRLNGYPSQWDSKDDQDSIKKGAFHALQFNYRSVLEF